MELAPKTVEDVPVGTRLCAYWSQQYRCLYPGRAIESESSDDGVTSQEFVSVEFDDGDSGRIRLQNIRLLLSDYPQVGKFLAKYLLQNRCDTVCMQQKTKNKKKTFIHSITILIHTSYLPIFSIQS